MQLKNLSGIGKDIELSAVGSAVNDTFVFDVVVTEDGKEIGKGFKVDLTAREALDECGIFHRELNRIAFSFREDAVDSLIDSARKAVSQEEKMETFVLYGKVTISGPSLDERLFDCELEIRSVEELSIRIIDGEVWVRIGTDERYLNLALRKDTYACTLEDLELE